MVKKGQRARGEGDEKEGHTERHGKNLRPATCSDGSLSLEKGGVAEERKRGRYRNEFQSHRGATGCGRGMGHETAIMSSLLLHTHTHTVDTPTIPLK